MKREKSLALIVFLCVAIVMAMLAWLLAVNFNSEKSKKIRTDAKRPGSVQVDMDGNFQKQLSEHKQTKPESEVSAKKYTPSRKRGTTNNLDGGMHAGTSSTSSSDSGDNVGSGVEEYAPRWEEGMTWRVAVDNHTQPKATPGQMGDDFEPTKVIDVYSFEVEQSPKETAQVGTFRVRVQCVEVDGRTISNPPQFYRMFFRADDHTLKTVQRLKRQDEQVEASKSFPRGPVDATDWIGSLPVVQPMFSGDKADFERTIQKAQTGTVVHVNPAMLHQAGEEVQKSTEGKEKEVLKISFWKATDDDKNKSHITQIWERGRPWWRKVKYGGKKKKVRSARLISVNGSNIRNGYQTGKVGDNDGP